MIRYFIPNTKGTILLCCCSVSYMQTILPVYSVPHLNANLFSSQTGEHRLHYISKYDHRSKERNISHIILRRLNIQWKHFPHIYNVNTFPTYTHKQWMRHLEYIMNKTSRRHHINKFKSNYTIQKLKTARWDLCLLISIKLQRQKTKQIT